MIEIFVSSSTADTWDTVFTVSNPCRADWVRIGEMCTRNKQSILVCCYLWQCSLHHCKCQYFIKSATLATFALRILKFGDLSYRSAE